MDYDRGNGFSAGVWAPGVSDRAFEGGSSEVDLYAGHEQPIGDFTLGVTAYYYRYPGARTSAVDESYNYGEIVPSISWKILTLSYAYTWSRDYNGYNSRTLGEDGDRHSRGSGYVDLSAELSLGEATALQLHAGHQRVRNFTAYNWSDARVTIEHSIGPSWTLSGTYWRGWFKDGIYDEFTTGVPDRNGVVHTTARRDVGLFGDTQLLTARARGGSSPLPCHAVAA